MCSFMDENFEATTGHIEGTPGYLAPEVFTSRKYSIMTDIFAFGCLMFYLLRREDPGSGAGFNSLATLELVEEVNNWAAETIEFCNSFDPETVIDVSRPSSRAASSRPSSPMKAGDSGSRVEAGSLPCGSASL